MSSILESTNVNHSMGIDHICAKMTKNKNLEETMYDAVEFCKFTF